MVKQHKDEIQTYPVSESSFAINPRKADLINQETPVEVLKKRAGRGGREFVYVETNWVIKRLNEIFGYGWDFEILEETPIELAIKLQQIVVKGRLTIKDMYGRTASKTQFGSSEVKFIKGAPRTINNVIDIADDYKAAGSDALKKCASYFGIALDVYSGEYSPEDLEVNQPEQNVNKVENVNTNTNEEEEEVKAQEIDIVEVKDEVETQKEETVNNNEFKLSQNQIKLIWTLAKEAGLSKDQLHDLIKNAWGIKSIKEIKSIDQLNELIKFLQNDKNKKKEV